MVMQNTQTIDIQERVSFLDKPLVQAIAINWEIVLFFGIMVLAFASRFYDLGTRVMSHDETSHVYFSWRLYHGDGYQHDPVTHGPLQFHLIALSYFLFGDNDFSARIPVAVFSLASIAFLWNYRRYLGRAGTLIASGLFLISPYMLYYGRYARNESYVTLFGLVTLWALLRYLEKGKPRYLYWLTGATVFHFTAKETSFIYTAQALVFLAIYFILKVSQASWPRPTNRPRFLAALLVAILLLAGALGVALLQGGQAALSAQETASPAVPGQGL